MSHAEEWNSNTATPESSISNEILRRALAIGKVGVFEWDLQTTRIKWSPEHCDLFGYTTERPSPVEFADFSTRVHPTDWPEVERRLLTAMTRGQEYRHEYRVCLPDGAIRWIAGVGNFEFGPSGEPIRMIGIVQDVTARKEAEASLREAYERFRLLTDAVQDIILLTDPSGQVLYISPSCEGVLGDPPEAFLHNTFRTRIHPDDRDLFDKALAENAAGRPMNCEWRCGHKNGSWVWIESLTGPLQSTTEPIAGMVCCLRDISQRKRGEADYRHAQKLDLIGKLAGGIAHNFNNLLTVVNGCGELLLEMLAEDEPARRLVHDILSAGRRGIEMTRQLLGFHRRSDIRWELIDLNVMIRETVPMLAQMVGEDVRILTKPAANLGLVRGDIGLLQQVLLNLVVNARDAMPNGGTLAIETSMIGVTSDQTPQLNIAPGCYVVLSVSDSGCGIAPDVQPHLFEPFFTTKSKEKGAGLGLTIVKEIVEQMRGFITFHSEPGKGTSFRIHLPKRSEPIPLRYRLRRLPANAGTELILIVEDDAPLRSLAATMLKRRGYRVLEAESGPDALRLVAGLSAPPDLVLTDMIMPEMSGRTLAVELRKLYPKLRIGFLSGYGSELPRVGEGEPPPTDLLMKPFSAVDLIGFVRTLLDRTI